MRAVVLGQIPDSHTATAVTADDLTLVRMNDDVVCGEAVVVAALYGSTPRLPNLDSPVFRAGHHPFSLAVEGDASDVSGVTLKGQQGVGFVDLMS